MSKAIIIAVLLVAIALSIVSCRPSPKVSENPQVMCKLPAVKGHCRALLPRWRYDPATGKCREFSFGGCDGNGNNFESQKACMAVCAGV